MLKLRQITRDQALELSQVIAEIPNQRIERVKEYLTEYYQDDIEIEQLAIKVNVSRSYLMREFKKVIKQTERASRKISKITVWSSP